jgi:hypothetical protein
MRTEVPLPDHAQKLEVLPGQQERPELHHRLEAEFMPQRARIDEPATGHVSGQIATRTKIVTSRRKFLQTAAALSAAPLAGRAAFAGGREPAALDAVIFDSRHAAARDFGARAGLRGAALRAIDGDITDLWQNELVGRWKAAPGAVAGLTERHALFLLERLGWDHGLRVVFEAEHAPDARGYAVHRVVRTADPGLALELKAAGQSWPEVLAEALVAGAEAPARDFRPSSAALAAHLGEATKLYSWIIAPRTAA